jgi:MFS family permease
MNNYPYQPVPPPMTRSSTMALVSLIAGIAGVTILPILGSFIAVITGHMAKSEINRYSGAVTGGGMATIGLILGYGALGLGICSCFAAILLTIFGVALPFGLTLPFIPGLCSGVNNVVY